MTFIIPDPRWEEPNLLIPGRKPVGPVQIDWSNPITRGLLFCLLPEQGLVHGRGRVTITLVGNFKKDIGVDGVCWRDPNTNTSASSSLSLTITGIPSPLGDITTLTRAARARDISGSELAALLDFRDVSNQLQANLGNGYGLLADDQKPRWAVDGNGTNTDVFMDGKKASSLNPCEFILTSRVYYTFVHKVTYSLSATRWALNRGDPSAPAPYTVPVDISAHFAWTRLLSDAEALSISADPYQFLIPA